MQVLFYFFPKSPKVIVLSRNRNKKGGRGTNKFVHSLLFISTPLVAYPTI